MLAASFVIVLVDMIFYYLDRRPICASLNSGLIDKIMIVQGPRSILVSTVSLLWAKKSFDDVNLPTTARHFSKTIAPRLKCCSDIVKNRTQTPDVATWLLVRTQNQVVPSYIIQNSPSFSLRRPLGPVPHQSVQPSRNCTFPLAHPVNVHTRGKYQRRRAYHL